MTDLRDALKWLATAPDHELADEQNEAKLTAIEEAAGLVAHLPTPEEISEWVNSQPGVRADWFNPFHAQAVLLAVGMGDKDWVGMGDDARPERERAAGSDGR